MNPVLAALMIPFLGTVLGSAFVFFMKRDMPVMLQKVLLGFASGVMVAASVWSLIIPAIEMGREQLQSYRRQLACWPDSRSCCSLITSPRIFTRPAARKGRRAACPVRRNWSWP